MFSTTKLMVIAALLVAPWDALAARIPNRRNNGGGGDDPQTSLTVDPRVLQPSNEIDGLENSDPGTAASLTSKNNFVNFCLTQDVPLTDGKQIPTGSCSPTPMGRLGSQDKQPSCKFVFPPNQDSSLTDGQAFTLRLAVNNLHAGFFTNPNTKYYSAPQTVDDKGIIIGHSHVVMQSIPSPTTTTPQDPAVFVFFKGLNAPLDQNNELTTDVPGLPAADYRLCTIMSSANHQPCLVSIAQHGSLDDCVYFTVKPKGGNDGQKQGEDGQKGKFNQ